MCVAQKHSTCTTYKSLLIREIEFYISHFILLQPRFSAALRNEDMIDEESCINLNGSVSSLREACLMEVWFIIHRVTCQTTIMSI